MLERTPCARSATWLLAYSCVANGAVLFIQNSTEPRGLDIPTWGIRGHIADGTVCKVFGEWRGGHGTAVGWADVE